MSTFIAITNRDVARKNLDGLADSSKSCSQHGRDDDFFQRIIADIVPERRAKRVAYLLTRNYLRIEVDLKLPNALGFVANKIIPLPDLHDLCIGVLKGNCLFNEISVVIVIKIPPFSNNLFAAAGKFRNCNLDIRINTKENLFHNLTVIHKI